MTQEQLIISAASGVAVLVLILIAWALGFRAAARVNSEADVRGAIADYEPGASVQHALIDASGRAALARLDNGRLATVRAMADGFAVRVFEPRGARITRKRFGARVTFADIGHPRVDLRFDGAPPIWLNTHLDEKK